MAKFNPIAFIQEVREETAKVTWPSWKEVWVTTLMVLIMVALASIFFLLVDQTLQLVNLVIDQIVPIAELEKALGTPMREAVQARADEAQFQRRAQAVEKDRPIKENELTTELELERRQQELIQKRGENALLQAQQEAASQRTQIEAAIERQRLQTEAAAQQTRVNAQAQAEAQQLLAAQAAAAMREQHAIWRDTPAQAATAMALSQLATKLQSIGHLNITPDLLGQSLTQLLRDQAAP